MTCLWRDASPSRAWQPPCQKHAFLLHCSKQTYVHTTHTHTHTHTQHTPHTTHNLARLLLLELVCYTMSCIRALRFVSFKISALNFWVFYRHVYLFNVYWKYVSSSVVVYRLLWFACEYRSMSLLFMQRLEWVLTWCGVGGCSLFACSRRVFLKSIYSYEVGGCFALRGISCICSYMLFTLICVCV